MFRWYGLFCDSTYRNTNKTFRNRKLYFHRNWLCRSTKLTNQKTIITPHASFPPSISSMHIIMITNVNEQHVSIRNSMALTMTQVGKQIVRIYIRFLSLFLFLHVLSNWNEKWTIGNCRFFHWKRMLSAYCPLYLWMCMLNARHILLRHIDWSKSVLRG